MTEVFLHRIAACFRNTFLSSCAGGAVAIRPGCPSSGETALRTPHRTPGMVGRWRTTTSDTWAGRFESLERINSIRETNVSLDSRNWCKRLGTSLLHELHESKLPFVSRIEFIRLNFWIFLLMGSTCGPGRCWAQISAGTSPWIDSAWPTAAQCRVHAIAQCTPRPRHSARGVWRVSRMWRHDDVLLGCLCALRHRPTVKGHFVRARVVVAP